MLSLVIGHYHFIIAYTADGQKPMWGKKEIFGWTYDLKLKTDQVLIAYLGSLVWINASRSHLTFTFDLTKH